MSGRSLYWQRTAFSEGATAKGLTVGRPIAFAMRSERSWSTAAKTETVAKYELCSAMKGGRRRTLPGLDHGALDTAEVARDVRDEVLLLRVVEDLLPERARLLEVELHDLQELTVRPPTKFSCTCLRAVSFALPSTAPSYLRGEVLDW